jgi:hypothetical protein
MSSLIVYCNEAGRASSFLEDENGCMSIGQLAMLVLVYQPPLLLFAELAYLCLLVCMIADCIARKRQSC